MDKSTYASTLDKYAWYTFFMIDQELKTHLENIEKELTTLHNDYKSLSNSFKRGIFYGAGYVIGVVLIIVLVGWILNIVGVIPAFNAQVKDFRAALERIGGPIK